MYARFNKRKKEIGRSQKEEEFYKTYGKYPTPNELKQVNFNSVKLWSKEIGIKKHGKRTKNNNGLFWLKGKQYQNSVEDKGGNGSINE